MKHLGLGRVPTYLLNAMMALAAPLSSDPWLASTDHPRWTRGDPFAQLCTHELFDQDGKLKLGQEIGGDEDLEVSQALICVGFHGAIMRLPGLPHNHYFSLAGDILHKLGVPDWGVEHDRPSSSSLCALSLTRSPAPPRGDDFQSRWRRRECFRRTLWVIQFINMAATSFNSTVYRFKELDLRLYFPVDEGLFDIVVPDERIPGVQSCTLRALRDLLIVDALVAAPEYLTISSDKEERPSRMYISEFGHVLRMMSIYARLLAFVNERRASRPHQDPDAMSDDDDTSPIYSWKLVTLDGIRSHESMLSVSFHVLRAHCR